MTIIPALTYVLSRAAWIPALVIWHPDGRFTRLEGTPCADYAAALAASWRPSNAPRPEGQVSPGPARSLVVASPRAKWEAVRPWRSGRARAVLGKCRAGLSRRERDEAPAPRSGDPGVARGGAHEAGEGSVIHEA